MATEITGAGAFGPVTGETYYIQSSTTITGDVVIGDSSAIELWVEGVIHGSLEIDTVTDFVAQFGGGAAAEAVNFAASAGTFTNYGVIDDIGVFGTLTSGGAGALSITNSGRITGQIQMTDYAGEVTFTNRGLIQEGAGFDLSTVEADPTALITIINYGEMQSTGDTLFAGGSARNVGEFSNYGALHGTVTFNDAASGVEVKNYGAIENFNYSAANGSFINNGTVETVVFDGDIDVYNRGYVKRLVGSEGDLVNDGYVKNLTTDYSAANFAEIRKAGAVDLQNYGTIKYVTLRESVASPGEGGTFQNFGTAKVKKLVTGSALGDTIIAGEKRLKVTAGAGEDLLVDGRGRDVFDGGADNDTLVFSRGWDKGKGGEGADVFQFLAVNIGKDVIRDFTQGEDKIDLDFSSWGGTVQDFIDTYVVTRASKDRTIIKVGALEGYSGKIVLKGFDLGMTDDDFSFL